MSKRPIKDVRVSKSNIIENAACGSYTAQIEEDKTWLLDQPNTYTGYGETKGEAVENAERKRDRYYND